MPEDRCWQELIPPGNIYFPIGDLADGDARDPAFRRSWQSAFRRYGLTPPKKTRPIWLDYVDEAARQGVTVY